jgi:hypothetical protein
VLDRGGGRPHISDWEQVKVDGVWGSREEREPLHHRHEAVMDAAEPTGEGGAALLIHRTTTGPGEEGRMEVVTWATVLIHHTPFLWPGPRREGGRWWQICGPEGVAAEGEEGSRQWKKREEVWARLKMR